MKSIELLQGTILLDDADYYAINLLGFKLRIREHKGYKKAVVYFGWNKYSKKELSMALSRFLMGDPSGYQVDHIDRNPLNNKRDNLRIASHQQNAANTSSKKGTSIYKGVSWVKTRKKWAAYLYYNGSQYNLGLFDCPHDAAEAYNEKSKEMHGEFSFQNVIDRKQSGLR